MVLWSSAYLHHGPHRVRAPCVQRSIWYMPPWAFIGGPVMSLHTILQLKDSPNGKVICYQEVIAAPRQQCDVRL